METNNIKLTDNEIIKALECCRKAPLKGCKECPYYEQEWCDVFLKRDVIDLINRQNSEIKRLEKGELSKAMTFNIHTIKECSAEAVKEFAHKIESYKTGIFIKGEELIILPLCDFEDIKSEMVGE